MHAGIYLGDDLTDIDAFRTMRKPSRSLDFQGFAIGITEDAPVKALEKSLDVISRVLNE